MEAFETSIIPVLTVGHGTAAVEFYQRAFGARELYRNTYPDGSIVAEMAVGQARFRVADEAPEAANLSPQTLGGTTVRINLLVADPDTMAQQAVANGAIEVTPIADQSYGLRQGRLADPFGHHWLIGPIPPDQLPAFLAALHAIRDTVRPGATAGASPRGQAETG